MAYPTPRSRISRTPGGTNGGAATLAFLYRNSRAASVAGSRWYCWMPHPYAGKPAAAFVIFMQRLPLSVLKVDDPVVYTLLICFEIAELHVPNRK
ncbi:hypothetical protein H6P81_012270 [Aristolochia fimbriata]|uniref:Uncharacterized protein n=1 Tax=Aristolochia fimbriata TaxID=158543 RepID=A0AAV7EF09_ARIFI|nr:hypothetical protein H6P81_012270 [Aristolochia fimbriata]